MFGPAIIPLGAPVGAAAGAVGAGAAAVGTAAGSGAIEEKFAIFQISPGPRALILFEFTYSVSPMKTMFVENVKPETIGVAIGPEGGFEDEEVSRAEECGFENVSLGPRILRTESAVLAALAIIQYEWGDVG